MIKTLSLGLEPNPLLRDDVWSRTQPSSELPLLAAGLLAAGGLRGALGLHEVEGPAYYYIYIYICICVCMCV